MMKKSNNNKLTLSNRIKLQIDSELIKDNIDIENLNDDEATLATRIFDVNLNNNNNDNDLNEINNKKSRIRNKNIQYLSSFNKRYLGKKIERKNLDDEDIDYEEEEEEDDVNIDRLDDEENDDIDRFKNDEDEQQDIDLIEKSKTKIRIMKDDDDNELILKAKSVKNQLLLYELLLNLRIKLQRLLSLSNQLSLTTTLKLNQQQQRRKQKLLNGLKNLQKIFIKIIDLITTSSSSSSSNNDLNNDDDDDGKNFKDKNQFHYNRLKKIYPIIVDKWYEKTKFLQFNNNIQNNHTLFDIKTSKLIEMIINSNKKQRLIDRTKLLKSFTNYKNLNNELIFDDNDFYQLLLRQIIENKSIDVDDNNNKIINNKNKKIVDTKASKGRKIRYNVFEKLINFMAPIDQSTIIMDDDAKNNLFKSLFGNFKLELTTTNENDNQLQNDQM